jgi:hypothetical protein
MEKMMITRQQLAKTVARAEEVLNLIGYIPVVSIFSAFFFRALGGKIQIIWGLWFALYHSIAFIFSKNKDRRLTYLQMSLEHAVHGFCNTLRSMIEIFPFAGFALCLPYDRLLKLRLKYKLENTPQEILSNP